MFRAVRHLTALLHRPTARALRLTALHHRHTARALHRTALRRRPTARSPLLRVAIVAPSANAPLLATIPRSKLCVYEQPRTGSRRLTTMAKWPIYRRRKASRDSGYMCACASIFTKHFTLKSDNVCENLRIKEL